MPSVVAAPVAQAGTVFPCHNLRPTARRPFVSSPYSPGGEGVLAPAIPDVGPCSRQSKPACSVFLHHKRPRLTGPCFPLSVVRCRTHGVTFTLYPPGHVPYGRKAIGSDVPTVGMAGAKAFVGTLFDASLDASQGSPWPRVCPGGSTQWWGTQRQYLSIAMHLCGVAPDMSTTLREILAAALQTETLLLLDGSAAITAQPGYQSRGQAVRTVLEQLPSGPCAIERLSVSGHLIGFWGAPYVWEPKVFRLRQLEFDRFDHDLRERTKAHPPRSTKVGRIRENVEAIGSAPSKERTLSDDSTVHFTAAPIG